MKFRSPGEVNLKKIRQFTSNINDWEERSNILKKGILRGALLDPLPTKTPLNSKIHGKKYYKDYSIENVILESIPGLYITGNLYKPSFRTYSVSLPGILLTHGHKQKSKLHESCRYLGGTLARMGAVVFSYDMVGCGDNNQISHKSPHVLTFQIWNSIRALDFLESLKYINPNKIGIAGQSGGGTQAFLLSAVDTRVKAAVVVTMISSSFFGGCKCESGLSIHRGENYRTNNAEIAALTAPRLLLIISSSKDWTRHTPVREYPFIKSIYELYGATDNVKNFHILDEPHDYGYTKRKESYHFFAKHFKLNIDKIKNKDGKIDESKTILGKKNLMHSFNKDIVRPENFFSSDKTIINTFRKFQN